MDSRFRGNDGHVSGASVERTSAERPQRPSLAHFNLGQLHFIPAIRSSSHQNRTPPILD
jgi:hypothetical protein